MEELDEIWEIRLMAGWEKNRAQSFLCTEIHKREETREKISLRFL